MRKFLGAAMVALLVGAPVQAACWGEGHVSAARVRDLQSFLMVETLRCQAMGFTVAPDYNEFVRLNLSAIAAANDRLKAFFIKAEGPVQGQAAYDRFTTTLANSYGAAKTNAGTCESARSIAREAAMMANSEEGLLLVAEHKGLSPALPGGRCDAVVMAELKR